MTFKGRIKYIDFLRVLSCFAVVFLHIATDKHDVFWGNPQWLVTNFYDGLMRWSVPVFVMISGTLFLSKKPSIKTILTKYLPRIVLVFAFWSGLYAVFDWIHGADFATVIAHFFQGRVHLWYLFMISGLYLATPLLVPIAHNKSLCRYFVVLAVLFAFLLPQTRLLLNVFGFTATAAALGKMLSQTSLQLVAGYSVYYLLGFYLHTYKLPQWQRFWIYGWGLFGLFGTGIFSCLLSLIQNKPEGIFFNFLTINVFMAAAGIFVWAKHNYYRLPKWIEKICMFLSPCCFGIYLVHPIFIRFLDRFDINAFSGPALITVPLLSAFVFICSLSAVWIIKKIPVLSKIV